MALFASVFLRWAGSQLRCGARLTCTLQKFICAFILTGLEQGSFVLRQELKAGDAGRLFDVSFLVRLIICLEFFQTYMYNWTPSLYKLTFVNPAEFKVCHMFTVVSKLFIYVFIFYEPTIQCSEEKHQILTFKQLKKKVNV